MADIVILGAGLTGLSAAYHLEQLGIYDYKLFEKDTQAGGLCRSIEQDGFTFDYTGHLLHINNSYVQELIEKLIGFDKFYSIQRKSFIYSQETYTNYPYQINLYGLPTETIAQCIEEFIKRPRKKQNPKNFREWVIGNFGKGFGQHFFFPYQQKIWRYSLDKLTSTWTGRFVPHTSLQDIIRGATYTQEVQLIGYNAQFFYPKTGGIYSWVATLASKLENKIYTSYTVHAIDLKQKTVLFTNGMQEPFKHLISTIPLDRVLTNLKEPSHSALYKASQKLLYTSVINFNLGINREDISEKHWIYYPEKKYSFYRIGFPHNFSPAMVPQGCSSLYGEFSYRAHSLQAKQVLLQKAITDTKKLLRIDQSDIITQKIIDIKYAYVIYNQWRDKHIQTILSRLEELNIYSCGRYGQWKYSSMQDALLDGKYIAETFKNK